MSNAPSAMAPTDRTTVTVHCHDIGTWRLPALHEVDGALNMLHSGQVAELVYELPPDLVTRLVDLGRYSAARFFSAWIYAGWDFEAAAWDQTLSLYRSLPELMGSTDDVEPEPGLGIASLMVDEVEKITTAIIDHWNLH